MSGSNHRFFPRIHDLATYGDFVFNHMNERPRAAGSSGRVPGGGFHWWTVPMTQPHGSKPPSSRLNAYTLVNI